MILKRRLEFCVAAPSFGRRKRQTPLNPRVRSLPFSPPKFKLNVLMYRAKIKILPTYTNSIMLTSLLLRKLQLKTLKSRIPNTASPRKRAGSRVGRVNNNKS